MSENSNNGTKAFQRFVVQADKILTKVETTIAIAFYALLIIIVLIGIFMRFVLRAPNFYGEELSLLLLFISVCLGINLGIRARSHLGVEVFISKLPKKVMDGFIVFRDIVVIAVYILMSVISFQFFKQSLVRVSTTPAMGMPYWVIYLIMAINFVLCAVIALLMFWNDHFAKEPVLEEKGGSMIE